MLFLHMYTFHIYIAVSYTHLDVYKRQYVVKGECDMDSKDYLVELRESTGMTRKEFCEYFEIPYRLSLIHIYSLSSPDIP